MDCYGRVRTGNNKFVPYLYPGQYVDEETGLAYNRFRYYDVESGRYLSQDPIGLKGGLRLYGFVYDSNIEVDILGLTRGPVNGDYSQMPPVDGYQKHHIISDSLRDHPVLREVGYDINSSKNLVYLPTDSSIDGTRTVHNGSHRSWHKNDMEAELNRIYAMDASPDVKRMHIDATVDDMRTRYLSKDPNVQLNKYH